MARGFNDNLISDTLWCYFDLLGLSPVPGSPLVPAGLPESPDLPHRGQVSVLAGSPLPSALGRGGESQA